VTRADAPRQVHYLTKWVPRPGDMGLPVVRQALAVSQKRMQTEQLDMLQFHWCAVDRLDVASVVESGAHSNPNPDTQTQAEAAAQSQAHD
jgi:aryl-alcohol dehydrogenase-like predicted oxidoreductase